MIKNKNLHIRVPQELRDKLKAIADRLKSLGYDTSKSDIIRTGVEKEVKRLNKMEKR